MSRICLAEATGAEDEPTQADDRNAPPLAGVVGELEAPQVALRMDRRSDAPNLSGERAARRRVAPPAGAVRLDGVFREVWNRECC